MKEFKNIEELVNFHCEKTKKEMHGEIFEYYVLKGTNYYFCHKPSDVEFLMKHNITSNFDVCSKDSSVISIGFNEKEQKWYGWSHRAIFGFGIGSKVKKGDSAYVPKNREDFKEQMLLSWKYEFRNDITTERETEKGFFVTWIYSNNTPNESLRLTKGEIYHQFPEKYGKGEWTAKTLNDAKEMAIDFSKSVS